MNLPRRRTPRVPSAGILTFIKDNEALTGLPNRNGSRAVPANPLITTPRS